MPVQLPWDLRIDIDGTSFANRAQENDEANAQAAVPSDTGWRAFAYTAPWVNNFGPVAGGQAGYRATGGVVRLGGNITGGATGGAAFTLPLGFRPSVNINLTAVMNGPAICILAILAATGVATPTFGAGAFLNLDGLTFTVN